MARRKSGKRRQAPTAKQLAARRRFVAMVRAGKFAKRATRKAAAPKRRKRAAGTPSPAQLRARRAFAAMAKARAKAARAAKRNPRRRRVEKEKFIIPMPIKRARTAVRHSKTGGWHDRPESRRERRLRRTAYALRRNPRGHHLPGLPAKYQRMYEHVLSTSGSKRIAAATVQKAVRANPNPLWNVTAINRKTGKREGMGFHDGTTAEQAIKKAKASPYLQHPSQFSQWKAARLNLHHNPGLFARLFGKKIAAVGARKTQRGRRRIAAVGTRRTQRGKAGAGAFSVVRRGGYRPKGISANPRRRKRARNSVTLIKRARRVVINRKANPLTWGGIKRAGRAARKRFSADSRVGGYSGGRRIGRSVKAGAKALRRSWNPKRGFNTFRGRPVKHITTTFAANGTPRDLKECGKLVDLKLRGGKTVRFSGAARLCHKGNRLYITGARFRRPNPPGEVDYGEILRICYKADKPHLESDGKTRPYEHKFGEEGGIRPHLVVDAEGLPIISGGSYTIPPEGIRD